MGYSINVFKRFFLLIIVLLITVSSGFSITNDEIISAAINNSHEMIKKGNFVIIDNWKIKDWVRITATPTYKYYDNIDQDQKILFDYIFLVVLHRLYFESLSKENNYDNNFFNDDIFNSVQILPLAKSEIPEFTNKIIERHPELYQKFKVVIDEVRSEFPGLAIDTYVNILLENVPSMFSLLEEKYKIQMMPEGWRQEVIDNLTNKIISLYKEDETVTDYENPLVTTIFIGVMITVALLTILLLMI